MAESTSLRKKTHNKKSDRIPFVITYNQFLANITKTVRNILQINENFKKIFKNEPRTAFKKNKNVQ